MQQQIHQLLVIEDQLGKRTVTLEAATYSIGRDPANSIVLYSNLISRQHAILLRVPMPDAIDLFRIIDGNLQGKRSTNGLTANGHRCFSHDLRHGDLLVFGGNVKARYYTTTELSDVELLTSCQVEDLSGYLESLSDPPTLAISDGELDNSPEAALMRLASFPELISNPILEIDLTGTITYLNPAAIVQFPDIRVAKLEHPILAGLLPKVQQGQEKFFTREVKVANQVFEQSLHYICESDLIRSYVTDVTERKQAEVALQQAHDELELKVEKRTAQLRKANEQLQQEITEHRRVEEALQQAEAKYRNIFENTIEGIFQTTPDGRYLSANPALARIYGYESPEELIQSLTDVVQQLYVEPHRRDEFVHLMQEHNTVSEFESQVYRKDGSIIWVSENARSVRDRNDQLLYYEGTIEDITLAKRLEAERQQAEEQLRHNAFHDALTGLPNRALFMDRLFQAIKQAKRQQDYVFAVLFLDLDRFKIINDSLGHLMGDELLIAIARRLEQCLRTEDTVARLGGDEFAILLSAIKDVDYPICIAQRIEQELALPFNLKGHEIFTSASIGIVISSEAQGWADDLLQTADIAMYHAKSLGGGGYQVFDTTRHSKAVTRLQRETDLRRAIEDQEFQVYYQPIVLLTTGSIVGFEALLRWQCPSGLISATEFIPIAEETGLIIPIGRWVLQEACRQMRAWQEKFATSSRLFVSVNLSLKQCTQPELVDQISQILAETNLDPQSLSLEITENVLLENTEPVAAVLWQLKALGISLYLDDFGTGYSSLDHLHQFPINVLKIDGSFINRMGCGNQSLEIARTIILLARALGMNVIAEGIETLDQLAQLSALSCKYGQGNLFSKPLDAATAGALVAEKFAGNTYAPCTMSDSSQTRDY